MAVDLQQYQNPKYTGKNRCMPCTITNVCIAAVLGLIVFVVSPTVAVLVVLASLATIYFRGYLVPGTPTLTKRYFPERILAFFDSHPSEAAVTPDGSADPTSGPVDPERLLVDLDAVRPCEDEDDLCLTEAFASAWYERMRSYRDDPRDQHRAATLLSVSPDDVSTNPDGSYPRFSIDWRTRSWPSDGALIADTAADAELAARSDDWRTLHVEQRLGILGALRTFIETCPVCDGTVEMAEDTIESCCRSRDVIAVACRDCSERLLELDPAKAGVEESPPADD